ncbi:MAG: hypothetical protein GY758_19540, partial [Fuerstiella sp.]|nr:hypothetical protein [Fuerstiella sp.]
MIRTILFSILLPQTVLSDTVAAVPRLPLEPFVQTRIGDDGLCSLTGRWLTMDVVGRGIIRAWSGILKTDCPTPETRIIQARQYHQFRKLLVSADATASHEPLWQRERDARIRHCGSFTPIYFDTILIQLKSSDGVAQFRQITDW